MMILFVRPSSRRYAAVAGKYFRFFPAKCFYTFFLHSEASLKIAAARCVLFTFNLYTSCVLFSDVFRFFFIQHPERLVPLGNLILFDYLGADSSKSFKVFSAQTAARIATT